jgi:hypothetical protein
MKWKPDKAPGRKREQQQRLERTQKRKHFAKNMERAEELAQKLYNGTKTAIDVRGDDTLGLEQKYRDWAIQKYHYLKFRTPMSQLHKDMDETWREIIVTAEACAKATAARIEAQDKKAHARWMAAEHECREGKRQQRELR